MSKKFLRPLLLALAVGSTLAPNIAMAATPAATPAAPAENTPEFNLATEVITATRTPQKLSQANADVTVITAKQIELHHYKNAFDALADVPGVVINKYAPVGYESFNKIYLNGSSNVVVLVNGVKQNIPGMSGGSGAQILNMYNDMGNIERIEVLHGSASTLYGSDAEGGVINIITKKITKPVTTVNVSYGSYNTARYSLDTQGLSSDGFGYRVFYQGNKQGNYRDGNGVAWSTHQHNSARAVTLTQALNGGQDNLAFNFNQSNYYSPYRALWETKTKVNELTQKSYTFSWDHRFDATMHNHFSINKNQLENNFLSSSNLVVNSIRIADHINKQYDKHLVSFGLERSQDSMRSTSIEKSTSTSTGTKEIGTTSVYLQDQYQANKEFSFTSGLRYDHNSEYGKHYSPSFTLGYTKDKAHLYTSYSGYYIAPTPYQLYSAKYGNALLQPETGYTKSLGLDYTFDKKTVLNANYFIRHSKDIIGYSFATKHYANLADSTTAKGWSLALKHTFNNFFDSNLSYTHTAMADDVAAARYMPNGEYTVGLNYHNRDLEASLSGNGRIGIATKPATTSLLPADTYWVWNLSANYKLAPNKTVYFSINNLFNKYYANFSHVLDRGGQPDEWWANPGRNFMVGFKYQF